MSTNDKGQKSEGNILTMFTIGHSNHEIDPFVELLTQHEIEIVADVRSSPYSKYAVQFNHDVIEHLVARANAEYQYFGSALGGKPSNPEFYDEDGRVDYGKIAESEWFQEGIDHLIHFIRNYRVAIMCSEENPSGCHRRLLITRVLMDRGINVIHIRGDGTTVSEDVLRQIEESAKDKGQLSMFDQEEPKEWKSIR